MITRRSQTPPSLYLRTPSPDQHSRAPSVVSDCEADDEESLTTMEDVRASPASSIGVESDESSNIGPYHPPRPTLTEVLSNAAPPPWTLSAFTMYLSQNHCLENLEFTLDAERYKDQWDDMHIQLDGRVPNKDFEEYRHLRMLWTRLMEAYIVPDCYREINIPSHVREHLLGLPNHSNPPKPEHLVEAVKIIYNLMEESVLMPFLNDTAPPPPVIAIRSEQLHPLDSNRRKRGGSESSTDRNSNSSRSKSKRRESPNPNSSSEALSSQDPTGRLTPIPIIKPVPNRARSNTGNTGDLEFLTDDSGNAPSPAHEPMTPPDTPPQSDFGGSSPRNRPDVSWKKMLGWKKRSHATIRDYTSS